MNITCYHLLLRCTKFQIPNIKCSGLFEKSVDRKSVSYRPALLIKWCTI